MELNGLHSLVVGMERSGVAATDFLLSRGARVTAVDQKPFGELGQAAQALRDRGVEFRLQRDGGFESFDLIIVSPGVPADIPELEAARARGVRVIGEVELAAPFLKGSTIGITGSNGKTTTTALTAHILSEAGVPVQVGGNIGSPVIGMVETSREDQWNVLELSSFQLETIDTFRPDIAVILNITQNHLDRHYAMARYADAKARILDRQTPSDYAVLNAADSFSDQLSGRGAARHVWFNLPGQLAEGMLWFRGEPVIRAADVPIRGRHNLENALAAVSASFVAGVPLQATAAAIRSFKAVEHRLEFVRRLSEIDFYNDSKATSVDATLKALDAFENGLWVILGGKDKGSDYVPLRGPLAAKGKAALLIGSAASKIRNALEGAVDLVSSETLDRAVRTAYSRAVTGDTILLAPACSSFDQFSSYEQRGRVFKDLVSSLEPKEYGSAA